MPKRKKRAGIVSTTASPVAFTRLAESDGPRSHNVDNHQAMYLETSHTRSSDQYTGTNFTYSLLEALAAIPQVAAIHQTRINHVLRYCRYQENIFEPGWLLGMADGSDPTNRDNAELSRIRSMIEAAGGPYAPGGFPTWLKMIVRDSLRFDITTSEVLRNSLTGEPYGFIAIDPATIRRKPPPEGFHEGRWDFVAGFEQWDNESKVADFSLQDIMWGVRRPVTGHFGYGFPEMIEAVGLATSIVNGQTSNAANITAGIHSHIAAFFFGKFGPTKADAIRRSFEASMTGPRQGRKVPLAFMGDNEKVQIEKLGNTNVDMEFSSWLNWLLKCMCAIYVIDPAEIGFVFGNEDQKNQMSSNSPDSRVSESRKRGLEPLLLDIASWINDWIIRPYWPQYRFSFTGVDHELIEKRLKIFNMAAETIMDVNEVRAMLKLPKRPDIVSRYPTGPSFQLLIQSELEKAGQSRKDFKFDSTSSFMDGKKPPKIKS